MITCAKVDVGGFRENVRSIAGWICPWARSAYPPRDPWVDMSRAIRRSVDYPALWTADFQVATPFTAPSCSMLIEPWIRSPVAEKLIGFVTPTREADARFATTIWRSAAASVAAPGPLGAGAPFLKAVAIAVSSTVALSYP